MYGITLNKEDHNGHVNQETQGFDHCVPLMIHTESEEEAKKIAEYVTEEFGNE